MNTDSWKKPVYFDLDEVESIAEEEATITLNYTPPVLLPEDTELEINHLLSAHEPETVPPMIPNSLPPATQSQINPIQQPVPTRSPLLWLVGSLGLLLVLMLLVDTYSFIIEQYTNSWFLGTVFLGLMIAITAAALTLSWRGYQGLRALQTVSALQQEGRQLLKVNGYGHAIHYLNRIAHFYAHRPDIKVRLERFYLILNDSHHDHEVCTLFSSHVMKDLDQQAYRVVIQRAKETALLTMLSQMAFLDTVLTLWRNIRLIRDIAALYGGRPGFLASISLISSVLQNLIYAGASEVAADGISEILGGTMLSIMSAQAAQGLGSGLLTARVGLHAMQACRPLPFLEGEKPSLKKIRREIVKSLKGAFETKEGKNGNG